MIRRRTPRFPSAFPTRLAAVALACGWAWFFAVTRLAATEETAEETPTETAAEAATEAAEPPITDGDRDHWAFKPLAEPTVPEVESDNWSRTPIDRFLLDAMRQEGLEPLPAADRATLIRRVTYDLTGLPPTPEEIDAFVNDPAPDAYEQLVDRLLKSPAYAERAAQHWLDLARFAETDGFEHDLVRSDSWKYRDWVIEAFAADMPYSEFVRRQIAGDLLPEADRTAVEFLIAGPDMPDINSQDERRHFVMNDMTATVGSVFLGLQLGCAACHNHKYDPISQHDFYRLRAYFEPLFEFRRNKRTVVRDEPETTTVAHLMVRGDFRRPGPVVEPAVPRIAVNGAANEFDRPTRIDLAEWLGSPDNPLALRVIVNRIWQQHFGAGLCRSPSDFGIMGDWPPEASLQLLDWLAGDFARNGGSFRALHRLLVTSAAYRTVSKPTDPRWTDAETAAARELWDRAQETDPDNRLLTHMPRQRLDGEAIRDAMLAVSGRLNRDAGGPGFRPPLPDEIVSTLLKNQWPVSKDTSQHTRRSIYLFVRRNLRYPLFDAFDKPDTNQSCPRRNRSTIAPQALILLNSKFSLDSARALATRLNDEHPGDPDAQIDRAYRLCLGRPATAAELDACRQLLAAPAADGDDVSRLAAVCLVLFNLNEFVYVD